MAIIVELRLSHADTDGGEINGESTSKFKKRPKIRKLHTSAA